MSTISNTVAIPADLETNKAIALRLIEVFDSRRLDLLEDVLHPEFRGRGISAFAPDEPEVGPGARRKLYEMFLQAIPDARGEVLDVVTEGDEVVLVDRFGGTHHGEFLGRPGTGDRIEWMAIHMYTIRDGKVPRRRLHEGRACHHEAARSRAKCLNNREKAALLGHQPRTYSSFAEELTKEWAAA